MRLKTLSLAMFTLGLTACASMPQSNTQHSNLNQQATTALNSLYTQNNYNFNIRIHTDINSQEQKTAPIQPKIIEQYILNQKLPLTTEQQNALMDSLNANTKTSYTSSRDKIFTTILENIAHYGEFQVNGGVDWRQKRANIEALAQYHDANLLVQYRFPTFIDLQQHRIYLNDVNLKNAPSKAQKNHQTYYFDFSEYQNDLKSINWKNIIDYLKTTNAIYFESLIGQENVTTLSPTTEERQLSVVKKIRLNTSIEEYVLKNLIFDAINRTYVENLIDFDKLKKATTDKASANTENRSEELADQLYDAVSKHFDDLESKEYTKTQDKVDDTQSTQQNLSFEQCQIQLKNKANFGLITECYLEYDDKVFVDDSQQSTSSWKDIIANIMNNKAKVDKIFSQYDNGELKTIAEFNEIIQKHQTDIEKLLPKQRTPIVYDVSVDAQGRLVGNTATIQLNTKLANKQVMGTINFDMFVKNYGKAKVELMNQNAKPISEHPWAEKNKSATNKYELSSDIAQSVYDKTKSYEKTYSAVFIAELAHYYPELFRYTTAQDLQEIALVYAYSYSDEELFKITPTQHKHIQQLEKKHNLSSSAQMLNSLGSDVAKIVETVIEDSQPTSKASHTETAVDAAKMASDTKSNDEKFTAQELAALTKQYPSPEQLFIHLYIQDYKKIYLSYDKLDQESLQNLNKTAQILAKSYVALRENRFNPTMLNDLTADSYELFSYMIAYTTISTVETAFPP